MRMNIELKIAADVSPSDWDFIWEQVRQWTRVELTGQREVVVYNLVGTIVGKMKIGEVK